MAGKIAVVLTLSLFLTICSSETIPDCKKLSFDDDYDRDSSSLPGILDTPEIGKAVQCTPPYILRAEQQRKYTNGMPARSCVYRRCNCDQHLSGFERTTAVLFKQLLRQCQAKSQEPKYEERSSHASGTTFGSLPFPCK